MGLYAIHAPGSASSDPSNDDSVYRAGEGPGPYGYSMVDG